MRDGEAGRNTRKTPNVTMLIASPSGKVGSLDVILDTFHRLEFETLTAAVPFFIASCATMLAMRANKIATTPDTQMLFHEMRVVNGPSDGASITTLHEYKEIVADMTTRQNALTGRTIQPIWDEMWKNLGDGDTCKGFDNWVDIVAVPISSWPQLQPQYKNDIDKVGNMLMVHRPLSSNLGGNLDNGGVLQAIYTLCGNWNDLTLSQSQIIDIFVQRARQPTAV